MLVLLCGLLYFANANRLPLADPEESRCALVVQQMVESGDYFVPVLGGEWSLQDSRVVAKPYYEKPASFFWLAAAGYKLTGSVELGGRLAAGLAGILGVLAVFGIARRLGGAMAGFVAGAVLASCIEYWFLARWYRMDMPFAAFIACSLWWYWRYEGVSSRAKTALRWGGFYFFCGLATLMKGPAGLVLPLAVVLGHRLLLGRWRELGGALAWMVPGLAVYFITSAPPYLLCEWAAPGSLREFIFNQNLARFSEAGAVDSHSPPAIIYIPVLLGGLLPWVTYLPGGLARTFPWRRSERRFDPGRLFAWLMAIVPLAFFMAASTRLPNYILPCFAGFAILLSLPLARWIESDAPDRLYVHGARALAIVLLAMLAAMVSGEFILPKVMKADNAFTQLSMRQWTTWGDSDLDAWAIPAIALVGAAVAGMFVSLRRNRRRAFFSWGLLGVVSLYLYATLHMLPYVYPLHSHRALARQVGSAVPADANLLCWQVRDYSFALYSGRTLCPELHGKDPHNAAVLRSMIDTRRPLYVVVPTQPAKHSDKPGQALASLEKASGRSFSPVLAGEEATLYKLDASPAPAALPVPPASNAPAPSR